MEDLINTIIRYFNRFFHKEHTVVEVTSKLTDRIGIEALNLFENNEFQKLLNFDKLNEDEKLSIQYELFVSGFTFGVLFFDHVAKQNESPESDIFSALGLELNRGFGDALVKHGANEEKREIWTEAIRNRVNEYRDIYEKNRNNLPKQVRKNHYWQYIVADRAVDRLRKGKLKKFDPLFEMIFKWADNISNKMFETVKQTL